jgi:hypothetical protein
MELYWLQMLWQSPHSILWQETFMMHGTRGIRVQEQILNTNKTRGNLISNTPQAACDETTRKIFLAHSNVQELALEIYYLLFCQAPCFRII